MMSRNLSAGCENVRHIYEGLLHNTYKLLDSVEGLS